MALATTTADAGGAYRVVVTIPAGTTPGEHTIVVTGPDGARAPATVTVLQPRTFGLLDFLLALLRLFG